MLDHQLVESYHMERYEDFLKSKGQTLSFAEGLKLDALTRDMQRLGEEFKREFPNIGEPISIQAEIFQYCQELSELNKRLKHQPQDDTRVRERTPRYEDLYKEPTVRRPEQHDRER